MTTGGEFWEAKSRTIVGDEEYVYLQLCLERFRWEFLFCYLRRNPLGSIGFDSLLEETLRGVLIYAWGIEFRSFSCPLLYWVIILD